MSEENVIVTLLAAINFTHVLDFVIMMPLGPIFMRTFNVTAEQFSVMVSAYTWAAGISALLGSFILDRFDRRSALLVSYLGFGLGTLACAFAKDYHWMVICRSLAGFFGGQVGTLIFSVVGDIIPQERRGRATGRISSAFALSSIIGVPLGLALTQWLDWHAPFIGLGVMSFFCWGICWFVLPSIRGHIQEKRTESQWSKMVGVLRDKNHQIALVFSSLLMLGGFMIIPFLSAYLVRNVGFTEKQLPLTYLVGGFVTFFTSQWIGGLSDRIGKFKMFSIMAISSLPVVAVVTHLPSVPVPLALIATTCFMITMSGRFVPALAIITSCTRLDVRGTFMSFNSAVHNLSAGLAAYLGGIILTTSDAGPIIGYNNAGWLSIFLTVISVILASRVQSRS